MKNIDKLLYTYKHRKVVMFLGKKYMNNKELLERLEKHDLDKMYLLLLYQKNELEGVHSSIARHHDNGKEKDYLNYVEMVLDWESARYTKPDKPLNAYDTLYKYYPHLEKEILPILKEFNIAKSNLPMEKDVVEYVKTLDNANEKDVKKELIEYINRL